MTSRVDLPRRDDVLNNQAALSGAQGEAAAEAHRAAFAFGEEGARAQRACHLVGDQDAADGRGQDGLHAVVAEGGGELGAQAAAASSGCWSTSADL